MARLSFHDAVPTFTGDGKEENKRKIKLMVAFISIATTAKVALSQVVPTVHFMQQWYKDLKQF